MRVCLHSIHIRTCVPVVKVKKLYGFLGHEALGSILNIREAPGTGPVAELIGTAEQSKKISASTER